VEIRTLSDSSKLEILLNNRARLIYFICACTMPRYHEFLLVGGVGELEEKKCLLSSPPMHKILSQINSMSFSPPHHDVAWKLSKRERSKHCVNAQLANQTVLVFEHYQSSQSSFYL